MNSGKSIKSEIKQAIIAKIENKIFFLKKRIEDGEETIMSENEENYDSRNNSLSYIQSDYIKNLEKTKSELEQFKAMEITKNNSVSIGGLIAMSFQAPSGKINSSTFFISPFFGGTKINIGGEAICLISPNSDFFKQAWDKKTGDTINMRISSATITKIE